MRNDEVQGWPNYWQKVPANTVSSAVWKLNLSTVLKILQYLIEKYTKARIGISKKKFKIGSKLWKVNISKATGIHRMNRIIIN